MRGTTNAVPAAGGGLIYCGIATSRTFSPPAKVVFVQDGNDESAFMLLPGKNQGYYTLSEDGATFTSATAIPGNCVALG